MLHIILKLIVNKNMDGILLHPPFYVLKFGLQYFKYISLIINYTALGTLRPNIMYSLNFEELLKLKAPY